MPTLSHLYYIAQMQVVSRITLLQGHWPQPTTPFLNPTEAKAKDKVLLASPNAAKVVTFITHIASCIQYVVHYQVTGLSTDARGKR